jgi:hypothetical protein
VSCRQPRPVLDCDAALLVAEPYFLAVREELLPYEQRLLGTRRLERVRLECAPWRQLHTEHGFGARNFAGTSDSGDLIVVCPELVELPPESVAAILAHELGHALDFLHPGRWLLTGGELVLYRDPESASEQDLDRTRVARSRQWEARERDLIEQTADALASEATGRQIRYAGPCLLQTFERGRPRPAGLR